MPRRSTPLLDAPVATRRSTRNIRTPVPADVPVTYVIPGRLEDEELESDEESLHGISPQASPTATPAGDSDVEIIEMPASHRETPDLELPLFPGASCLFCPPACI